MLLWQPVWNNNRLESTVVNNLYGARNLSLSKISAYINSATENNHTRGTCTPVWLLRTIRGLQHYSTWAGINTVDHACAWSITCLLLFTHCDVTGVLVVVGVV